ncbi:MAG: ABC transporter permease [Verrucomicrobiales bacterium]|jgi:lipoprotein-releasing system permease protein|nr:ABC transporter permease [Verrucomicrobiales bacterium]
MPTGPYPLPVHRFVELFIALRYLRPKRSFVSIITVLSLLGVLLGVGVLIIVLSVMEGFERELRDKVLDFTPHVTVANRDGLIDDGPALMALINRQPGVVASAPTVLGQVLARVNDKISAPYLRGVDPATSEAVVPMERFIVSGEPLLTADSVWAGLGWALRNHAKVGDRVLVYAPSHLNRYLAARSPDGQDQPPTANLPGEYTISALYSTGYYEYDNNYLLFQLAEARRLYDLGPAVHALTVRTQDPMQAWRLQDELRAQLPPSYRVETWMDQNRVLLGQVAVERRVMAFILFFIIIVAALGLCSTLITVTVQKSREIGLMKALGASDRQIVSIFTLYGFIIGTVGSGLGVLAGNLLLRYRNEFSAWLNRTFNIDVFPPSIYHFAQIPALTDGWMMTWIALAGVALSTAAALAPAFAALRVDPATTLHAE